MANPTSFKTLIKPTGWAEQDRTISSELGNPSGYRQGENSPQWLEEFRQSAIPDRLAVLNHEWFEPADDRLRQYLTEIAIANAQKSTSYTGKAVSRILDRYANALEGGWASWGSTINGEPGAVPQIKLQKPRESFGSNGFSSDKPMKSVKYETPPDCPATPILPWVSWEAGWQIAKNISKPAEEDYVRRFIQQFEPVFVGSINPTGHVDCAGEQWRPSGVGSAFLQRVCDTCKTHGIKSGCDVSRRIDQALCEADRTFWRWFQSTTGGLALCEGLKKAEAMIARGTPAIALRGVACWHPKGDKTALYESLADFATEGRKIWIAFDQDLKPKTVKNVGIQINQLGKVLQRRGCAVFVLDWLPCEGKGIDDAIFKAGENGQHWLDKVVSGAPDLNQYQKKSAVPRLLAAIERAKTLEMIPDRDTEGDYLPECSTVEAGAITVIEAPTGAGKTTEIRRQIATHRANGGNTIVLYSLNALGQQTATAADLPHLHDYDLGDRAGAAAFEADISHRHGIVLCFDSLHRIPAWFLEKPLLLVLDEANQGTDHLVFGGTLGDRQAQIVHLLSEIATRAATTGAIVLAEARVYPDAVKFAQSVSGCQSVKYVRHNRIVDRGTVEISSTGGLSALYSQALAAVDQGEKIIWASTSQANTRLMDLLFSQAGKRVGRIDSQTNRNGEFRGFFDNPNDWLEANSANFDVLILSPSCKTGVSITFPAFHRVFGYFPCLGPDDALQMLTRYRLPVPRHVYIPQWIQTQGDESLFGAARIKKRLALNAEFSTRAFELDMVEAPDDRTATIAAACLEYYASSTALRGMQKAIAAACLGASLAAEGFAVTEIQAVGDRLVSAEIAEVRDLLIWRADAATMARALPYETTEGARRVLGNPSSLEDEFRANKTLWIERFPGIDFDDAEVCYHAIYRQRGLMARGVEQQAAINNLGTIASLDATIAGSALKSGLNHKLPRKYARSLLLQAVGILDMVAVEDCVFTNADALCQRIQAAALKYRGEIRYWLSLTITEEYRDAQGRRCHTPIDVCSKLLGKLGLSLGATARPGGGRDRQREYRVVPIVPTGDDKATDQAESWKYRQRLLASARQRLATLTVTDKEIATVINAEPEIGEEVTNSIAIIRAGIESGVIAPIRTFLGDLTDTIRAEVWRRLSPDQQCALGGAA
jgi:Domain of unknown function (DUF3854)